MAKYRLELAKRRKWGGFVKYPNCGTTLCLVMSRTGSYHTGLSDEDVDRLAKATGMARDALLPPSSTDNTWKVGSYWKNFAVKITTKGTDIDTDKPFDEILYLFCLAHPFVTNSKNEQPLIMSVY